MEGKSEWTSEQKDIQKERDAYAKEAGDTFLGKLVGKDAEAVMRAEAKEQDESHDHTWRFDPDRIKQFPYDRLVDRAKFIKDDLKIALEGGGMLEELVLRVSEEALMDLIGETDDLLRGIYGDNEAKDIRDEISKKNENSELIWATAKKRTTEQFMARIDLLTAELAYIQKDLEKAVEDKKQPKKIIKRELEMFGVQSKMGKLIRSIYGYSDKADAIFEGKAKE